MFDVVNIAKAVGEVPPVGRPSIIRFMWSQPLPHPPGMAYHYANFNYCLLGRVIEAVTGQPYEGYVLATTLHWASVHGAALGHSLPEGRRPGESTYEGFPDDPTGPSVFRPGKTVPAPYGTFDLENMDAHGGWVSSALDLVRFASVIFDGAYLTPATLALVVQNAIPIPETTTQSSYGLGWILTPSTGGYNWWHNGDLPGSCSILVRLTAPGVETVYAAVLNRSDAGQNAVMPGALDSALGAAVAALPAAPAPVFPYPRDAAVGLSNADATFKTGLLASEGYRALALNGYAEAGVDRYAAAYEKSPGPRQKVQVGMTSAQYRDANNMMIGQGYRIFRVSSYTVAGVDLYAAVWDQGSPNRVENHRLPALLFGHVSADLSGQGYRLLCLSGCAFAGSAYYAGAWEQAQGPGQISELGMNAEDFTLAVNAHAAAGHRMLWLSGFTLGGADYYAALWEQAAGPAQEVHFRLTADQLRRLTDTLVWGRGYLLSCVCGYEVAGTPLFAAIWNSP